MTKYTERQKSMYNLETYFEKNLLRHDIILLTNTFSTIQWKKKVLSVSKY